MSAYRRFTIAVTIAGIALLASAFLASAAGVRVNTSKSIPLGLYWVTESPVQTGAYVMLCPPDVGVFREARNRGYLAAGPCPGDFGYLMKRVVAAGGDQIAVTNDGVRVNGQLIPHSAPLAADPSGRPMPRYQVATYALGAREVLLMSGTSPTSFDGRYYGPLNVSQIRAVIRPVFTW